MVTSFCNIWVPPQSISCLIYKQLTHSHLSYTIFSPVILCKGGLLLSLSYVLTISRSFPSLCLIWSKYICLCCIPILETYNFSSFWYRKYVGLHQHHLQMPPIVSIWAECIFHDFILKRTGYEQITFCSKLSHILRLRFLRAFCDWMSGWMSEPFQISF